MLTFEQPPTSFCQCSFYNDPLGGFRSKSYFWVHGAGRAEEALLGSIALVAAPLYSVSYRGNIERSTTPGHAGLSAPFGRFLLQRK